jgi:hypothetical protein
VVAARYIGAGGGRRAGVREIEDSDVVEEGGCCDGDWGEKVSGRDASFGLFDEEDMFGFR